MAEVEHTVSHVDDSVHQIFHYALLTLASIDLSVHAYVIFLIVTVAKDTLKTFRYYLLFGAVSRLFSSFDRATLGKFINLRHYNCRFAKFVSLSGLESYGIRTRSCPSGRARQRKGC